MTSEKFIYSGYDPNGIKRVWGEHKKPRTAEALCVRAALDYIRGHPDTGPLDRWSFTHNKPVPQACKRGAMR